MSDGRQVIRKEGGKFNGMIPGTSQITADWTGVAASVPIQRNEPEAPSPTEGNRRLNGNRTTYTEFSLPGDTPSDTATSATAREHRSAHITDVDELERVAYGSWETLGDYAEQCQNSNGVEGVRHDVDGLRSDIASYSAFLNTHKNDPAETYPTEEAESKVAAIMERLETVTGMFNSRLGHALDNSRVEMAFDGIDEIHHAVKKLSPS